MASFRRHPSQRGPGSPALDFALCATVLALIAGAGVLIVRSERAVEARTTESEAPEIGPATGASPTTAGEGVRVPGSADGR